MSLAELIDKAIDNKIKQIPQTLVCTVETFDKEKLRAKVQPLYRSVFNGVEIPYPVLSNIPVLCPVLGNDVSIRPDYKKGDLVLVVCSTFNFDTQMHGQSSAESDGLFGKENAVLIGGLAKTGWTEPDKYSEDGIILNYKNLYSLIINDQGITVSGVAGSFNLFAHTHTSSAPGSQTSPPTITGA